MPVDVDWDGVSLAKGGGARRGRRLVRRARAADARRHEPDACRATCRRRSTVARVHEGIGAGHGRAQGRRRPAATASGHRQRRETAEKQRRRRRRSREGRRRQEGEAPQKRSARRRDGARSGAPPSATNGDDEQAPEGQAVGREEGDQPIPRLSDGDAEQQQERVPQQRRQRAVRQHHPPAQPRHAGGDEEQAAQRRDEAVDRDVQPAVAREARDEPVDLRTVARAAGRSVQRSSVVAEPAAERRSRSCSRPRCRG